MKYEVTLRVSADQLGPLVTAATPLASGPLRIREVQDERASRSPARAQREPRQTPVAETRLGVLVLAALGTGPCSLDEVRAHIVAQGFSPGSASPTLSRLRAAGHVLQQPDSRWALPGSALTPDV